MAEIQTKPAKPTSFGLRQIWMILVLFALGGIVGYGVGRLASKEVGHHLKSTPWLFQGLVITLPLSYFIVVGWHELGHVVGGLLVRFRFNSLLIGPMKLEKKEGRLRLRLNRSLNLAGGLTLMLPDDIANLRNRFITYIAAGPISSVVLTLLCRQLSLTVFEGSPFSVVTDVLACMSALIFVVTAVPLKMGGMETDGKQILNLLIPKRSKVSIATLSAIAHGQSGGRPRDLSLPLIVEAIEAVDTPDSKYVALQSVAYLHLVDDGKVEEAEGHLEELVNHIHVFPAGMRESLWLIPAFHAAFYDRNLESALAHYSKYRASVFSDESDEHRLRAALACLEGDADRVKVEVAKARENLSSLMEPGLAPFYRDCLDELERRAGLLSVSQ
jgi:hypothetical protein